MVNPLPLRPQRRSADASAREERLEVLRMLESGAITADDADRLLDALDRAASPPPPPPPPPPLPDDPSQPGGPARQVRIRVSDGDSGRSRVNLILPLGAIDAGLGIAARFAPDYFDDPEALRKAIFSAGRGPLIDVEGDDGERVEVIVE